MALSLTTLPALSPLPIPRIDLPFGNTDDELFHGLQIELTRIREREHLPHARVAQAQARGGSATGDTQTGDNLGVFRRIDGDKRQVLGVLARQGADRADPVLAVDLVRGKEVDERLAGLFLQSATITSQ